MSIGIRDHVREESELRVAGREAARWDQVLAEAAGERARVARDRALGARRRMVRARLTRLLSACPERDGLVVRLDRWLSEEQIGVASLERLADALRTEEHPDGRTHRRTDDLARGPNAR